MSNFLNINRTVNEWKELVENMQSNTDNIVYNFLVELFDGDFDHINRNNIASKINVNIQYIDYIIDYYSLFEKNPYKSYQDYFESLRGKI